MKNFALLTTIVAGILAVIFANIQIGLLILLALFLFMWILSLFSTKTINDPGQLTAYTGLIGCIAAGLLGEWVVGVLLFVAYIGISTRCNIRWLDRRKPPCSDLWLFVLASLIVGAIMLKRGHITIGLPLAIAGLLLAISWLADVPRQKERVILVAKAHEEQKLKAEQKKQADEARLAQQITKAVNTGSLEPLLVEAKRLYHGVYPAQYTMDRARNVTDDDIARLEERLIRPLVTIARNHGLDALLDGLDSGDMLPLHSPIIDALIAIQDPKAEESLLAASRRRYRFSLKAQGALARVKSIDDIIRILTNPQEDSAMRIAAALTLEEMGDPQAVEPLVGVLKTDYRMLRMAAAEALGKLRDPLSVDPLIEQLSRSTMPPAGDDDIPGILAITRALAEIGDKRAIEPIRRAMNRWPWVDSAEFQAALTRLQIGK